MSRMKESDGASAVEYGLIVFAIAGVIAAVVFVFGRVVNETYDSSCERIAGEISSGTTC